MRQLVGAVCWAVLFLALYASGSLALDCTKLTPVDCYSQGVKQVEEALGTFEQKSESLMAENKQLRSRIESLEKDLKAARGDVTLLKNSPANRFGGIFVLQDGPVGSHDNALSGTKRCPEGFQEKSASRMMLGLAGNEGGSLMVCVR